VLFEFGYVVIMLFVRCLVCDHVVMDDVLSWMNWVGIEIVYF